MNPWTLEKEGFDPRDAAGDGNRFLSANGYMGLRGAPEEAGAVSASASFHSRSKGREMTA